MKACITGASSGIGRALAYELARQGYSLLLTGRNKEALEALEKELGATTLALDLQEPADRATLIDHIHTTGCTLIINNAGLGYFGDALKYSTQEQLEVIRVNNEALLEITLESARYLKESNQKGTILNVASVAALFPFPFHAVYSSSKVFVKNLSLALDAELSPFGIRVLVTCPGLIVSNFRQRCTKSKASASAPHYMPTDKAAARIARQIQTHKRIDIFPFSFRLLSYLARLIPTRLLYAHFKHRYPSL